MGSASTVNQGCSCQQHYVFVLAHSTDSCTPKLCRSYSATTYCLHSPTTQLQLADRSYKLVTNYSLPSNCFNWLLSPTQVWEAIDELHGALTWTQNWNLQPAWLLSRLKPQNKLCGVRIPVKSDDTQNERGENYPEYSHCELLETFVGFKMVIYYRFFSLWWFYYTHNLYPNSSPKDLQTSKLFVPDENHSSLIINQLKDQVTGSDDCV